MRGQFRIPGPRAARMVDRSEESQPLVGPQAGREGAGLAGLGCLAALLALGGGGGGAAVFLGVARIVRGSLDPLESMGQARALALSLEGAVVLCAVGALGILLGGISLVLILKELGDQSARRRRGPI